MSIRTHLTQTLGATHLLMLDNATALGDGLPIAFDPLGGSFEGAKICEGISASYRASADKFQRGTIPRCDDINNKKDLYQHRTLCIWFASTRVDAPTGIYAQGGGGNNFAILVGIARAITVQAADDGQPFLIAQSAFLAEVDRPYFICFIWQRPSEHEGAGTRILLYINGVHQHTVEQDGTEPFPGHNADIGIGNCKVGLKSYNGAQMQMGGVIKDVAMLGMFNDRSFNAAECRDLFERSVVPLHVIEGNVAQQQAALDALSGTEFAGQNCAIRIVQATNATDYRLILDDLRFMQDPNLRDIAVQYVGPHELTLLNANGSNAVEICTPPAVDLDGITVLEGGGSVALVEKVIRAATPGPVTGDGDLLIITSPGAYVLNATRIPVVENISGGAVQLSAINGAQSPTSLLESFGSISLSSAMRVQDFGGAATKLIVWNAADVAQGKELYPYQEAISHRFDTSGLTRLRVAIAKPGHYAQVKEIDVREIDQLEFMALNATPNMDVNTDISALITASDMAIIADPYGAGFDVLRATISGDHFNITAQQWLRFTDYAAGTKEGLTALGLYGLSGEDVYQATPSGLAVLRPVIEARARATNRVEVKAYIDASGAKALFAGYEYAPRNAENVAIQTTNAEPLVDYNQMQAIMQGAIALTEDYAQIAAQNTQK